MAAAAGESELAITAQGHWKPAANPMHLKYARARTDISMDMVRRVCPRNAQAEQSHNEDKPARQWNLVSGAVGKKSLALMAAAKVHGLQQATPSLTLCGRSAVGTVPVSAEDTESDSLCGICSRRMENAC